MTRFLEKLLDDWLIDWLILPLDGTKHQTTLRFTKLGDMLMDNKEMQRLYFRLSNKPGNNDEKNTSFLCFDLVSSRITKMVLLATRSKSWFAMTTHGGSRIRQETTSCRNKPTLQAAGVVEEEDGRATYLMTWRNCTQRNGPLGPDKTLPSYLTSITTSNSPRLASQSLALSLALTPNWNKSHMDGFGWETTNPEATRWISSPRLILSVHSSYDKHTVGID
jgi:hypothetical protein